MPPLIGLEPSRAAAEERKRRSVLSEVFQDVTVAP